MNRARCDIRRRAESGLVVALLAASSLVASDDEMSSLLASEGFRLVTEHCSPCHGPGLSGGRARSLRTGEWLRVKSDADMARIIRDGLSVEGMTSFGETLSNGQIETIVTFIRKYEKTEQMRAEDAIESAREGVYRSELEDFRIETIVTGLEVPWSFAFLPDNHMVVAERPGRVRFVDGNQLSPPVEGIPEVWARQDGGLLALALDPDYARNGWIYFSFAEPGNEVASSMTKIVRGRVRDNKWEDEQVVWSVPQELYHESNIHYGTRLLFEDGCLFFSIGDRGRRETPQDLTSPFGKIHRVNPDGSIPDGNPFADRSDACASVWTYGHRNPQGLAVSPTGELWSTEHGPMGGDELNLIRPGKNYGWPVVTYGIEHNGRIISEFTTKPGMEDPAAYWVPSIATSAIEFYTGDKFPAWKNQLFLGSLLRQEFRRIVLDGNRVVRQELVFKDLGRIRDIHTGPDGYLYLSLERFGRFGSIVRLVPGRD